MILQEGLQSQKGTANSTWFPNTYGTSNPVNTNFIYNYEQGNFIPQVDGGNDPWDDIPVLHVRPPNLSSANLSTTKLPTEILSTNLSTNNGNHLPMPLGKLTF